MSKPYFPTPPTVDPWPTGRGYDVDDVLPEPVRVVELDLAPMPMRTNLLDRY